MTLNAKSNIGNFADEPTNAPIDVEEEKSGCDLTFVYLMMAHIAGY